MLISLLIPKNMQNFSQFYRLISKIVFFSTQKLQVRFPTGGAATGSLPGRPERLKNVPDHLEWERVWLYIFGDFFDERRAAPPAYGRRAWSKVVSYLMVFWYVFRYWSEFRRRLKNKTVLNYGKLVKTMLGQLRNSLFDFEALACRRCALLENCSLDRLFQMARRARWNNPKCT